MRPIEKLTNLRQLIAPSVSHFVPLGVGSCDRMLGGGLQTRALHEVFAHEPSDAGAATGFALGLIALLSPDKTLFWIRQDFSALEQGEACAAGLSAFGIDPSRLVIVRVADVKSGLRACGEVLSSTGIGTVLFELSGKSSRIDLAASRRLTLSAHEGDNNAILLRFDAEPEPSAAATRWRIAAASGPAHFDAELIRNRHGGMGRWSMEWNNEQRLFRDDTGRKECAAHSGLMATASSDRSPTTARVFTL